MRTTATLTLLGVIALLIMGVHPTRAETPLPETDWYAVIWNRTDDTLHWVNDATELASIPRPQLPGETAGADLTISPNGRWMMMTAMLEDQRQGIGFYDFQTGDWLQVHTAQPGESIVATERNPFSRNSEYAAIGLHSDTGWRVITFETATGDARDVLTDAHPDIAPDFIPPQAVPRVTLYSLDEGMAQWRVHIRFVTLGPNQTPTPQPALGWYPQQDNVYVDTFHPLLLDLDILPLQGRVLYSLRDDNDPTRTRIYQQTLGHEGELAYEQGGAFINQPRWVAGGQFVAYRVTQGAQVPMWYLGGVGSADLIPFGPDYDELLGTVDGFVLVDYEGGEVKFANTLAFEAFSPTVGNVIYTTDTSNFHIAYITPMGLDFTLESLATPPEIVGGDTVQSPALTCGTAPPPRLTVGDPARVNFTTGTPLNIRTEAAGDFIMQIAEGTPVQIVGGPVCRDNFLWWELTLESEDVTVGGWAAEGDAEDYYLEPITMSEVNIDALNPTPLPPRAVNPPRAHSPGDGDCSNAPVGAQLAVGEYANVTLDAGSTLAMRANLDDPTPFYNVASGRTVTVLEGPACNGGFRMWYVSLGTPDGPIEGWVADGFGQNRYLRPGPARSR